ncbi:uncharacterized protein J4E87_002372 [Alternaria ethzedia]|uniref:uncharacterized protein n=1 Tax=Alternaria ethzedia TaxID=181014 RepID=UPI0020C4D3B9|nr:uncharacterized protein J4E87_002372 [Alternaria ethzedia]KAI4631666.1 hypothetical protein J4E87_002372 [Alternaria ethzedia]
MRAGGVYQQIIEKVIQTSQNDFEESGVDHSTLDEMKQGWQERLSALKIAHFPWDPAPEPVRQPPTVPSNVKVDNDMPSVSGPQEALNFPNVPVKQEGGYQPPVANYPPAQTANNGYGGTYDQNQQLAHQRAAALVQQRVQQQGHVQQNFPNLAQQGHLPQMPMQNQQQQQQQRMMAQQQQQQQQQHQRPPQQQQQQGMPQQRPPPQNHMYTSQTDGSGDAMADWEALKAARAADAVERMAADDFMRSHVDAMAMRQDSGLMVPLNSMPKGRKRKAAIRVLQAEDAEASSSAPVPARFDGDDDVKPEEDPDDAINSDLDDSEDELGDGDNSDDEMVDYMLCTYDKVQRVKNKWKCTLKDGILTTNKKE